MTKRIRRRSVATVLFAAGLTATTVAFADMDAAREALSNKDYPAAVQALDAVLEQQPSNVEAHFLKGLALARQGKTDAAVSTFEELTSDHSDMAEAWNNLGVLRARNGNLTGARDALQRAIRINPEHGPAQENLGDIYVALARNAYGRAGELESDNAIARAKSQQLAAFIDNAGGMGGQSADTSASASEPPPVPNVTTDDSGRFVVDTSTPEAAVESWARAWSAQDVDAYLGLYSDDFVPEDAPTRAAWAAERRERVNAPSSIEVSLSNARMERRGDQALMRFTQHYQSDSYEDREAKALLLENTPEGWKILREGANDSVSFTAAAPSPQPSQASVRQAAAGEGAAAANTDAETQATPATAASTQAGTEAGTPPGANDGTNDGEAVAGQIRGALEDWATAWSNQNVQGYLNAYSDNFEPAGDQSLAAWARDRRERVSAPAWIKVDLNGIDVTPLDSGEVRATFDQHYQSNTYEDRERKRVTLTHEDGGWRIIRES